MARSSFSKCLPCQQPVELTPNLRDWPAAFALEERRFVEPVLFFVCFKLNCYQIQMYRDEVSI